MAGINSPQGHLTWKERLLSGVSDARRRVTDTLDAVKALPEAVRNVIAARNGVAGTLSGPGSGATVPTVTVPSTTGTVANQPSTANLKIPSPTPAPSANSPSGTQPTVKPSYSIAPRPPSFPSNNLPGGPLSFSSPAAQASTNAPGPGPAAGKSVPSPGTSPTPSAPEAPPGGPTPAPGPVSGPTSAAGATTPTPTPTNSRRRRRGSNASVPGSALPHNGTLTAGLASGYTSGTMAPNAGSPYLATTGGRLRSTPGGVVASAVPGITSAFAPSPTIGGILGGPAPSARTTPAPTPTAAPTGTPAAGTTTPPAAPAAGGPTPTPTPGPAPAPVPGAPVTPPPAPPAGAPPAAPGAPPAAPNTPVLRQSLDDEIEQRKTSVITDPVELAALQTTLDTLKTTSLNEADIVRLADELLARETLKHNEYVRVAAMPTRKLIQAAIDALKNKKAGNELDNLPDEDRQALIEAAERVKDTKPPNLNSTDFIVFLDIKPDDHSPIAEAIRRFIQERLNTNPNFEFEGFRDFIKDPSSLTAALIAQERQKLAPLEKSIRDAERTIAALEKERNSYTTGKGSSVTEVKQAQDQITAKISQQQDIVDKAKNDKQPIDQEIVRLEKITLGDKRKFTPRGQLEMLYLYMDAKKALENKDDLDRDKVNEKSNEAIKTIEKEQRDNVGSWEQFVRKVFGSLRPDLESTLRATQAKDINLKDIPVEHMAKLADIADDPQELNDWVQALPGDEAKRMETYIPKLMGYLKVMVNSGGKAKVNNEGIESANKLLEYFDGIEMAYACKKAAETPGKPIDQMIAFSNCRNATETAANDARQKIIDEHLDLKRGTQLAEAVVDKASKLGFIGLTLAQSPLVAALGVGPAVTAYLALRGMTAKDEAEKKRMKKYAIAMGMGTALASGGIAMTGLGAIPILGMVAGAKALKYTYDKNKVKAKRLAGNVLNILSLGLFSGSNTIRKLLTAK